MGKYVFKTNINCLGCASQIKPHLDKLEKSGDIKHWHVHPTDPDHTLEIESNRLNVEEVRAYVRNAGFEAEPKKPARRGAGRENRPEEKTPRSQGAEARRR